MDSNIQSDSEISESQLSDSSTMDTEKVRSGTSMAMDVDDDDEEEEELEDAEVGDEYGDVSCAGGHCGLSGSFSRTNFDNDNLFKYNGEEQMAIRAEKPYKKDVNYFTDVKISSLALMKMVKHARSGGSIEVMGLMTGKIVDSSFIVMDAYPLPVEGTETRVNAMSEGYEFMVQYIQSSHQLNYKENVVGWYHSHPGYGCWLSGIDVETQMLQQQFQDPFVAVVIDPEKTMAGGKVEIGAFRTYPEKEVSQTSGERDSKGLAGNISKPRLKVRSSMLPMGKAKDFGAHSYRYYALDVLYFKSSRDAQLMDQLWSHHWTNALSQWGVTDFRQGYITDQIMDLAKKFLDYDRSEKLVAKTQFSKASTAQLSAYSSSSSLEMKQTGPHTPARDLQALRRSGSSALSLMMSSSVRRPDSAGRRLNPVGETSRTGISGSVMSPGGDTTSTNELREVIQQGKAISMQEAQQMVLQRAKEMLFG